jgi:signal transduction histidine kinase
MKSAPKLIKRFMGIFLLSSFLILIANALFLILLGRNTRTSIAPGKTAEAVAAALTKTESGYVLPANAKQLLQGKKVWAILIDNSTGRVVWHSDDLPAEIPMAYSLSDIAVLSRSYLKDYPTFTSSYPSGLIVLGFPKASYWKLLNNSWDLNLIANLPKIVLAVFLGNALLIFLIYMVTISRLAQSVNPILKGIEALPAEKEVYLKERGILSEIAAYINRTASILKSKNYELMRKERARANWIAGVSHDIRTPLSMVLGYASQLKDDENLPEEVQKKATMIQSQSIRMKNLINDLNLASKLEYNMQPLNGKRINAVSAVRQTVVDFINEDPENMFPIEWLTADDLTACFINGDVPLIKRAVTNLIQNSISHNENGCSIFVSVSQIADQCLITVDDDGIGVDDKQLEELNHTQHYLVCDGSATG